MNSALLAAFDRQVGWCRAAAAPFTARVLESSRHWLARDAAAHAAFAALARDPLAAAVALRWAAALHHLALRGLQPWAALWPPAAGVPVDAAPDAAFDRALAAAVQVAWQMRRADVAAALALPPQTNEVQRSAVLLPGLLDIAARTARPLVLLEIGAAAGLNLWCDRYRHVHAGWRWGDETAPLTLRADWRGAPPPLHVPLQVARRAGCDASPIDLARAGAGLRLASFIWPEQPERLARLHAARAAVAGWMQRECVAVEPLSALAFVQRELHAPKPGHTTVLMHSVVCQYIDAAERAAISAEIAAAAARASADAPLAWLRMEPLAADVQVELRCSIWPADHGGSERLLARCHPHGAHVDWLAEAAA